MQGFLMKCFFFCSQLGSPYFVGVISSTVALLKIIKYVLSKSGVLWFCCLQKWESAKEL